MAVMAPDMVIDALQGTAADLSALAQRRKALGCRISRLRVRVGAGR
jgi:hypothetical protein